MTLSNEQIIKLKSEKCKKSYYHFFLEFWETVVQDDLIENWHIKELCDEVQKVGEWVINREAKEYDLNINISPGESKSTICTVLFPAWLWTRDATIRIISASYSADLALEHAQKSKDCIDSDKYRLYFPDVEIRKDINSKGNYQNTKGGSRKIASTGGTVTGKHAHILIWDDLLNPKKAESGVERKNATDFLNKTLSSRKIDKTNTPMIGIAQRLHQEDPSGDWLAKQEKEGKRLRHICIPANNDFPIHPPELERFYEDGIMNPLRTGKKVLADEKVTLGAVGFAGQFGQQPSAMEGNIIKRDDFIIKGFYELPEAVRNGVKDFVADTAYTKKQDNDPSAALPFFAYRGYLFIFDYLNVRQELPELKRTFKDYVKEWGTEMSRFIVEPKASGLSVIQELREMSTLNVMRHIMIEGDKIVRLNAVSPKVEAGRVVLVQGPWNETFINEVCSFPNAKHDEAVDLLIMSIIEGLVRNQKRNDDTGRADYRR